MKKLFTVLLATAVFGFANAQEETETNEAPAFNQWSIDVGFGAHKPVFPMGDGFRTNRIDFWQGNLGVRYMLNEKAGLRLGFGYNNITQGEDSKEFESRYMRGSIEGVVNLGNVLNFRTWTRSIGLQVHGGGGISVLTPQSNEDYPKNYEWGNDKTANLIAGISPQLKLGNKVALFGDFSGIANFAQNYSWEGNQNPRSGQPSFVFQASLGLNIYFGGAENHADWFYSEDVLKEMIEENADKIANNASDIETLQDDVEGLEEDANGNGIPDHIEDGLNNEYVNEGDEQTGVASVDVARQLLDEGYAVVYFNTDSSNPKDYNSVGMLATYMKKNPTTNATLTGYADERGSAEYNAGLAERRAQKVHDILVAAGIDPARLTVQGQGEDETTERPAYQLSRVVTFKLD